MFYSANTATKDLFMEPQSAYARALLSLYLVVIEFGNRLSSGHIPPFSNESECSSGLAAWGAVLSQHAVDFEGDPPRL